MLKKTLIKQGFQMAFPLEMDVDDEIEPVDTYYLPKPSSYENIEFYYVYKKTYDENLKEIIWFSGVFGVIWALCEPGNTEISSYPNVFVVRDVIPPDPCVVHYLLHLLNAPTLSDYTDVTKILLDNCKNRFGVFRGDNKYLEGEIAGNEVNGFVLFSEDEDLFLNSYTGGEMLSFNSPQHLMFTRKNLSPAWHHFQCFCVSEKSSGALISYHQFNAGRQPLPVGTSTYYEYGFRGYGRYDSIHVNGNSIPIIYDPAEEMPSTPPTIPVVKSPFPQITIEFNSTAIGKCYPFVWVLYNKTYDYLITTIYSTIGLTTIKAPTGGEFALEFVHKNTVETLRRYDAVNNVFFNYPDNAYIIPKEDWHTKFIVEVGQGTGDHSSDEDANVYGALYDIRYCEDAIILDCLNKDFINECFPDNNFISVYAEREDIPLKQAYYVDPGTPSHTPIGTFLKMNKDGTYPDGAEYFDDRISKIYICANKDADAIGSNRINTSSPEEYVSLYLDDPDAFSGKPFNQYENIYIRHYCMIGSEEVTIYEAKICPNDSNILKVSTMPDTFSYYYEPYYGDIGSFEDYPRVPDMEYGAGDTPIRFGVNNIVYLYDFTGFDVSKKLLNKATKKSSINGVRDSDISNDKLLSKNSIISFQGNSYVWDTYMETNYEKGKDGIYKVTNFMSLDFTDKHGIGYLSLFYGSSHQCDISIHYDSYQIGYNGNLYQTITDDFNILSFGIDLDDTTGDMYYSMFYVDKEISDDSYQEFLDGSLKTVRLFQIQNDTYSAYEEYRMFSDNITFHEIRGVFLNIEVIGEMELISTEMLKLFHFLQTHRGYQKYTDCLPPKISEYNIPELASGKNAGLLLPCVGTNTNGFASVDPCVDIYTKIQESPEQEISFDQIRKMSDPYRLSKSDASSMGYYVEQVGFVPLSYGKFQKLHLISWYPQVHFSYGMRYKKSNEYYLGTTYYNGNYDRELSAEKTEYLNERKFETKEYDFKVFVQNNDINTLSLPIVEATYYDQGQDKYFPSYIIDKSEGMIDYSEFEYVSGSTRSPAYKKYVAIPAVEDSFDDGRSRSYDVIRLSKIDTSPVYKKYIYGDEIVELKYTKTIWLDTSEYPSSPTMPIIYPDGDNISQTVRERLGYSGEIFLALFEYNDSEREDRKLMTKQPHGMFEFIRSVDDVSMLVLEANLKDKLINDSSDLFGTTSSPSTIELQDDVSNWSKFNPDRKYKASKNDAVYFFEGNKEDYLLTYVG